MGDKSNEITAIPELLEMLVLEGGIMTIDAIGCQKWIAQTIRDRGGDYALALKDNQPPCHEAVVETFAVEQARKPSSNQTGSSRAKTRSGVSYEEISFGSPGRCAATPR